MVASASLLPGAGTSLLAGSSTLATSGLVAQKQLAQPRVRVVPSERGRGKELILSQERPTNLRYASPTAPRDVFFMDRPHERDIDVPRRGPLSNLKTAASLPIMVPLMVLPLAGAVGHVAVNEVKSGVLGWRAHEKYLTLKTGEQLINKIREAHAVGKPVVIHVVSNAHDSYHASDMVLDAAKREPQAFHICLRQNVIEHNATKRTVTNVAFMQESMLAALTGLIEEGVFVDEIRILAPTYKELAPDAEGQVRVNSDSLGGDAIDFAVLYEALSPAGQLIVYTPSARAADFFRRQMAFIFSERRVEDQNIAKRHAPASRPLRLNGSVHVVRAIRSHS